MIYIIIILVGLYLIVKLGKLIGNVLLWCLGIAAIGFGLYFAYRLLAKFGATILQIILLLGAVGLVALAVKAIVNWIKSTAKSAETSRNALIFSQWLDSVGIGKYSGVPGNPEVWKTAIKNRRAIEIDSEHAISVSFSEGVVTAIHNAGIVKQTDLWAICRDIAHEFETEHTMLLMSFLESKHQIVVLNPPNRQKCCLAIERLTAFEELLLDHDEIRTVPEYTKVCASDERVAEIVSIDKTLIYEILRCLSKQGDELTVKKAKFLIYAEEKYMV